MFFASTTYVRRSSIISFRQRTSDPYCIGCIRCHGLLLQHYGAHTSNFIIKPSRINNLGSGRLWLSWVTTAKTTPSRAFRSTPSSRPSPFVHPIFYLNSHNIAIVEAYHGVLWHLRQLSAPTVPAADQCWSSCHYYISWYDTAHCCRWWH